MLGLDSCATCDHLMQDLPPNLLPYLRLGHCTSSEELKQHGAFSQKSAALPPHQEAQVLQNLASCLQQRLQRSAPVYTACLLFISAFYLSLILTIDYYYLLFQSPGAV